MLHWLIAKNFLDKAIQMNNCLLNKWDKNFIPFGISIINEIMSLYLLISVIILLIAILVTINIWFL